MKDFILVMILGATNGIGWGLGAPQHWTTTRTVVVGTCFYIGVLCAIGLVRG